MLVTCIDILPHLHYVRFYSADFIIKRNCHITLIHLDITTHCRFIIACVIRGGVFNLVLPTIYWRYKRILIWWASVHILRFWIHTSNPDNWWPRLDSRLSLHHFHNSVNFLCFQHGSSISKSISFWGIACRCYLLNASPVLAERSRCMVRSSPSSVYGERNYVRGD